MVSYSTLCSGMEVDEDHIAEKVMNDSVVRKDEEPVNIDFTISEIQNKLLAARKKSCSRFCS